MSYSFNAKICHASDDGDTTIIGFANDPEPPSRYVIVQRAREFDDQDRELGMDQHYLEINDQSRSAYGVIESVRLATGQLTISLKNTARDRLLLEGNIVLVFDQAGKEVKEALRYLYAIAKADGIPFSNETEIELD